MLEPRPPPTPTHVVVHASIPVVPRYRQGQVMPTPFGDGQAGCIQSHLTHFDLTSRFEHAPKAVEAGGGLAAKKAELRSAGQPCCSHTLLVALRSMGSPRWGSYFYPRETSSTKEKN